MGALAGAWRTLPKPPLPADVNGSYYTGVWTGTELVIHVDLDRANPVDIAYNPRSRHWRTLPAGLLPRETTAFPTSVWDGTEMLIWASKGAGFNPATNHWRSLPAAPIAPTVTVWTGTRVLMWDSGCCVSTHSGGATFDPATDSWQPIPQSPLAARYTTGVWTGTELVVVGGFTHAPAYFADAAAYNPTSHSWRTLPPLPAPRFFASMTWTGSEVVVLGGVASFSSAPYDDGLAYSPATNSWRVLPAMETGRAEQMTQWAGERLLVWGGESFPSFGSPSTTAPPHGLAYDPATNGWSLLPKSPLRGRVQAVTAWTGTELIIWGGIGVGSGANEYTDGATLTPEPG
jgi:N-acetylneuraminic acid mutarotase